MINYFLGCSFLNLFTKGKIIVDIRSGYIHKNNFKRFFFNSLLLLEVSSFKNITVISKNLSKHLNLPKRAHHIPLGSPSFSKLEKKYESFKLLYVGTFYQRNLHQAIKGFSKFYFEYKDLIKIEMNLIGVGNYADIHLINNTISELGVGHVVKYLGEIRYPELNKYFEYHNIGLSYIPLTQYFNFQPPTKTFEYLSSGMITIATSTVENISVINESNGILIRDNEDSLFEGLKFLYNNKNKYNSFRIQDNSRQYSWENIVFNNLLPYLNKLD
uniref:glycosyltransferase n=1 Tax=Algoriphagus sp. TaxID=1872435 RepID=UPI004047FBB1